MSKSLAVAISVGILAAVWNALSGDYLGNIVATSIAAMDLFNPVAIVLVSSILGVVAGNLAERLAAAIK